MCVDCGMKSMKKMEATEDFPGNFPEAEKTQ